MSSAAMATWPGWSYLLAAIGICGLILAGNRHVAGWYIGLSAQLLWIAYALFTRQYGFIVSAVAYGIVYGRNAWKWRQDHARLAELRRRELINRRITRPRWRPPPL